MRPHEVVLTREAPGPGALMAQIKHIGVAGPTIRIELQRLDDGGPIDAELTAEHWRSLDLKVGETVFVSAWQQRSFEDYAI